MFYFNFKLTNHSLSLSPKTTFLSIQPEAETHIADTRRTTDVLRPIHANHRMQLAVGSGCQLPSARSAVGASACVSVSGFASKDPNGARTDAGGSFRRSNGGSCAGAGPISPHCFDLVRVHVRHVVQESVFGRIWYHWKDEQEWAKEEESFSEDMNHRWCFWQFAADGASVVMKMYGFLKGCAILLCFQMKNLLFVAYCSKWFMKIVLKFREKNVLKTCLATWSLETI